MRAVVTGAARGLGAGIAARLVADGGDVVLVDLLPAVDDEAERLAAGGPGRTVAVVGDVAAERLADAAVARAVEEFGGLDLLVACAGIGGPGTPVWETDPAAFRRTVEVNLVGTFHFARAAARRLLAQGGGGSIVCVSSLFAQQASPFGASYNASKAGVTLLMQTLALEAAPHGIRVNAVAPGYMATEMHWDELRNRAQQAGTTLEVEVESARGQVPLGRHGTGEDVAGAVVWLSSRDASYVTGQTIAVNGGVFLT